MQHVDNVGGIEHMEVDHFDPRKEKDYNQSYENLFLSKRACNNKKRKNWPSASEQKLGIRFLNPCKEMDYGEHIFEDPDTHEVWGATVAGRYHIITLGLNTDSLIKERQRRSKIEEELNASYCFKTTDALLLKILKTLRHDFEIAIPHISLKKKPKNI